MPFDFRRRKIFFLSALILSAIVLISIDQRVYHYAMKMPFGYYAFVHTRPANVSCDFPRLDPWDRTIEEFVEHDPERSFNCTEVQPYLTWVDAENRLWINTSEIRSLLKSAHDILDDRWHLSNIDATDVSIQCGVATFERVPGEDDDGIEFDPETIILTVDDISRGMNKLSIVNGFELNRSRDFARVSCTVRPPITIKEENITETTIYLNFHPFVNPSRNFERTIKDETDDQLSVLLLVVDSTSHQMLERYAPNTTRVLRERLRAYPFRGFSKVADNSFPNMVPVLTGKRVYSPQKDMPNELPFDYSEIQFDGWPLIYKDFSSRGYVTAWNEDMPEWGIFQYFDRNGFAAKPTNHSYRPFWLSVQSSMMTTKSNEFCHGNVPKLDQQIDIIDRLLEAYTNKLKFIVSYFVEITHDDDSVLALADERLSRFLERFENLSHSPTANKTVLILMSDHGHRFADIRRTLVGLFEERMPMFWIRFPPWFLEKHPNIREALEMNELRLSSHFDVHETLRDVLNADFTETSRGRGKKQVKWGRSQLYELPLYRDCFDAGIPDVYCPCAQFNGSANLSDPLILGAASFIAKAINRRLASNKNCSTLKVDTVIRAEISDGGASVVQLIRVAFVARPGRGEFEGVLQYSKTTRSYELVGEVDDISRLNQYNNQSYCANDSNLKKFCLCHMA